MMALQASSNYARPITGRKGVIAGRFCCYVGLHFVGGCCRVYNLIWQDCTYLQRCSFQYFSVSNLNYNQQDVECSKI